MKPAHSPAPWKVQVEKSPNISKPGPDNLFIKPVARDNSQPFSIAVCPEFHLYKEQSRANAAHIVQCVNERDELLATIRILISKAAAMTDAENPADSKAIQDAIALLRRARGEL